LINVINPLTHYSPSTLSFSPIVQAKVAAAQAQRRKWKMP
jgi:hypothetical protein